MAAFLQPLFLFQFIHAWNKHQGDHNFIKQQLAELEWFDASLTATLQIPIPELTLTATTPAPPS